MRRVIKTGRGKTVRISVRKQEKIVWRRSNEEKMRELSPQN